MQMMLLRGWALGLGLGLMLPACTRINPGFGAGDTDGESGTSAGTGASATAPTTASSVGSGSNSMSGPAPTGSGPTATAGMSTSGTTDDPTSTGTEGTSDVGPTTSIIFDIGGETEDETESETDTRPAIFPPCEEQPGDVCYDMTRTGNILFDQSGNADLTSVSGSSIETNDWGPALDCDDTVCRGTAEGLDLGSNGITLEVWFEFTQVKGATPVDEPMFDIATTQGGVALGVTAAGGNGNPVVTARYESDQVVLSGTTVFGRQCVAIVANGGNMTNAISVGPEGEMAVEPLFPNDNDLDFANAALNLGPFAATTIPVIIHGVRIHATDFNSACSSPGP